MMSRGRAWPFRHVPAPGSTTAASELAPMICRRPPPLARGRLLLVRDSGPIDGEEPRSETPMLIASAAMTVLAHLADSECAHRGLRYRDGRRRRRRLGDGCARSATTRARRRSRDLLQPCDQSRAADGRAISSSTVALECERPSMASRREVGRRRSTTRSWSAPEARRARRETATTRGRPLLDLRQIAHFARCCFEALSHLHASRLTHTDLKPENVLFVEPPARAGELPASDDVTLIDFGGATWAADHHDVRRVHPPVPAAGGDARPRLGPRGRLLGDGMHPRRAVSRHPRNSLGAQLFAAQFFGAARALRNCLTPGSFVVADMAGSLPPSPSTSRGRASTLMVDVCSARCPGGCSERRPRRRPRRFSATASCAGPSAPSTATRRRTCAPSPG